MKTILVTGGLGFIGSHTVVTLIENGFNVVVIDDLSNSSTKVLQRLKKICGTRPEFLEGSINDANFLRRVFSNYDFYAVVHFAALKSPLESFKKPSSYYYTNIGGTINLLNAMEKSNVSRLVFSSSAAVYGKLEKLPLSEEAMLGEPKSIYAKSKLVIENLLKDICVVEEKWKVAILRYFNPIGAHPSGLIGEDPKNEPTNLIPIINKVALGFYDHLTVFGNDYPTVDGTGVRDFIHVVDLAEGHLSALNALSAFNGCETWNLGTGQGYSVLQVLDVFEKVLGKKIPYKIRERRQGDPAQSWADIDKAKNDLKWRPVHNLEKMICDSWNWQKNNPYGYEK